MKREIWCRDCDFPFKSYPEEGSKKVSGKLKFVCLCDGCGKELPAGSEALAVSIFRKREYFPWEDEYLTEKKVEDEK